MRIEWHYLAAAVPFTDFKIEFEREIVFKCRAKVN